MKKAWEKPKLIVLVRSEPQEMTLTACKQLHNWTGSPTITDDGCNYWDNTLCFHCDTLLTS